MNRSSVYLASVLALVSGLWLAGLVPHHLEETVRTPDASHWVAAAMTLRFSTYLGGSEGDAGSAIAIDAQGYIYVAGQTASSDFPTRNAAMSYQGGSLADTDVFIAKLTPDGDSLVYATYLGGSGDELATALVVDAEGRVIVAGSTSSSDFPTNQTLYPYRGGQVLESDAFIARLRADGSAVDFATYLGGTSEETITALALGSDGSLYGAGSTMSVDFPVTPGTFQATHAGGGLLRADAFLIRLNPEGNGFRPTYVTYLGGRIDEVLSGLAIDEAGRAYVTGFTNSPDFPTQNALQDTFAGPMRDGEGDVFLARFTPAGDALDFSTYLGQAEDDQSTGLVLQPNGTLYLTGWTRSLDFPTTAGAVQRSLRGTMDAFLVRLTPSSNGVDLDYATFLGGSGEDAAYGLAAAPDGAIWLSGATDAAAFPQVLPTQLGPGGGATEAFVAHLSAEGDSLALATYLGGSGNEAFPRAALGADGVLCVTGTTLSYDFPTRNAMQTDPRESTPSGSTFLSCFGEADAPVATESPEEIPTAFALHANYPNPFNPTTIIPFSVAQSSRVVLEVFDVTGRRVATLVDGTYPPGRYETRFDAHGLASGLYLYRIQMDDFQAARSLVLVR